MVSEKNIMSEGHQYRIYELQELQKIVLDG
jgi:hypothetical protein